MYIGALCKMSDNKIGAIDSSLYYKNPFLSGLGQGSSTGAGTSEATGAVSGGGKNLFGGNSAVGSELSAFKAELPKFSAGQNVDRSGFGQAPAKTNEYAQDQDLYNRVSNIPSCDSFANMDTDQERTLYFA